MNFWLAVIAVMQVGGGMLIGILYERLWLHPRFVRRNAKQAVDQLWSDVLAELDLHKAKILRAGAIARRHGEHVVFVDEKALAELEPYRCVPNGGGDA